MEPEVTTTAIDIAIGLKYFFILLVFITSMVIIYKFVKGKYYAPFMRKLNTMLNEGKKDKWSSQRFNLLITLMASNCAVWGVFFFLCIWEGKIVEIPGSVITLYVGANGLAGVFKGWQKDKEVKEQNGKNGNG